MSPRFRRSDLRNPCEHEEPRGRPRGFLLRANRDEHEIGAFSPSTPPGGAVTMRLLAAGVASLVPTRASCCVRVNPVSEVPHELVQASRPDHRRRRCVCRHCRHAIFRRCRTADAVAQESATCRADQGSPDLQPAPAQRATADQDTDHAVAAGRRTAELDLQHRLHHRAGSIDRAVDRPQTSSARRAGSQDGEPEQICDRSARPRPQVHDREEVHAGPAALHRRFGELQL